MKAENTCQWTPGGRPADNKIPLSCASLWASTKVRGSEYNNYAISYKSVGYCRKGNLILWVDQLSNERSVLGNRAVQHIVLDTKQPCNQTWKKWSCHGSSPLLWPEPRFTQVAHETKLGAPKTKWNWFKPTDRAIFGAKLVTPFAWKSCNLRNIHHPVMPYRGVQVHQCSWYYPSRSRGCREISRADYYQQYLVRRMSAGLSTPSTWKKPIIPAAIVSLNQWKDKALWHILWSMTWGTVELSTTEFVPKHGGLLPDRDTQVIQCLFKSIDWSTQIWAAMNLEP